MLSWPLSPVAADECEDLLAECVMLLEATTTELETAWSLIDEERSLRRDLESWKSEATILISDQQSEIGTLTTQRNERDARLTAAAISFDEYRIETRKRIWTTSAISAVVGALMGALTVALVGG